MRAAVVAMACLLLAPLAGASLGPTPSNPGAVALLAELAAPHADALRTGLALAALVHPASPLPVRGSLGAAHAWLLAEGATPADADAARAAMAALPPTVGQALLDVVAAFAAFEAAARLAPTPELVAGPRLALLASAIALRDALGTHAAPVKLQVPPILALDLAGTRDVYVPDFALSIDVGGDDLYLNAAGGTGMSDACPLAMARPASAAIDLAGNDQYVSNRRCGINGGGWFGAGFLLDAAGDDVYGGYTNAVNGGSIAGAGFLLDAGGNDVYAGDAVAVNGGGALGGHGALLDLGGADTYRGAALAVNGGGSTSGVGFLLDAAGDDVYVATNIGVNGGGWLGGQGMLLDAAGNDRYEAGILAPNGAGGGLEYGQPGIGLLLDGQGQDAYVDGEGGSGDDVTVLPKGTGAQVDLAG